MATPGKSFHLALDLGAESGRAILGRLSWDRPAAQPADGPAEPSDEGRLETWEVHRFAHEPVETERGLLWDIDALWAGICEGIRKGAEEAREQGGELASLGVDTWGVDYTLLDADDQILEPTHAYRDPRNAAAMAELVADLGEEKLYRATGNQLMPFNTLFQLRAQMRADRTVIQRAQRLLFLPDLFHWRLTGRMVTEISIASTSQLMDPRTRDWNRELARRCGLPLRILGKLVPAGTVVGPVLSRWAQSLGLPDSCLVVAPATHDTASAIAAIPAEPGTSWAYLSSGTWSLLGTLLAEPCLSEAARSGPFTHEIGAHGEIRFLKMITGLWLVQGLRKELDGRGQSLSYGELQSLATAAPAHLCVLDEDDPVFQSAGKRIEAIQDFARRSHQPVPETPGALVRCCLETLALSYRHTLHQLESVLNQHFDVLHVVGGGGRNELLNQMCADAIERPVIAGPFEATSLGNLLVQARALGLVQGSLQSSFLIQGTCAPRTFEPTPTTGWDEAYARYLLLKDD